MLHSELVKLFVRLFGLKEVNWSLQTRFAKQLLLKYSYNELVYALNFYKERGSNVYSLAFLFKNMKAPLSLMEVEDKMVVGGDVCERNNTKIRNNKAFNRERDFEYLFTESGETD